MQLVFFLFAKWHYCWSERSSIMSGAIQLTIIRAGVWPSSDVVGYGLQQWLLPISSISACYITHQDMSSMPILPKLGQPLTALTNTVWQRNTMPVPGTRHYSVGSFQFIFWSQTPHRKVGHPERKFNLATWISHMGAASIHQSCGGSFPEPSSHIQQ